MISSVSKFNILIPFVVPIHNTPESSYVIFLIFFALSPCFSLYTEIFLVFLSYIFKPLFVAIKILFACPLISFIELLLNAVPFVNSEISYILSFFLSNIFTPFVFVPIHISPSSSSYIPCIRFSFILECDNGSTL